MRTIRDVDKMIFEKLIMLFHVVLNLILKRYFGLLVEVITLHNLPFQFVEYEGIRALLDYLRPRTHVVSRNTVNADAIKM